MKTRMIWTCHKVGRSSENFFIQMKKRLTKEKNGRQHEGIDRFDNEDGGKLE